MIPDSAYTFDVIVVGGGHAGIEAAYASAKMGAKTALITLDKHKIGLMPCNPAIGGIGKGHLVFEISALGGLMPQLCSKTYLQVRMLNTSKGPAVHGLRLQIDKEKYRRLSLITLEKTPNLTIIEGHVYDVIIDDNNIIQGIVLHNDQKYWARTIVLTTGTFLNGRIHIGPHNYTAGRRDEEASVKLPSFLKKTGLILGRLKTGTPPRILRSSIDFSKLIAQEPDVLTHLFEFESRHTVSSHTCYIARTNAKTHAIIQDNIHLSAMYNGNISGIGPRYCPSIEDKIGRFKNKESHQIFIEPESAESDEIYPNGISTSLPHEVQIQYVRSIEGFENAIISKPGYAVEYDFVLPNQLTHSLETKVVPGLFLAGQINGTTGYEEAAGQGIIAGINAACKALGKSPFIPERNESYLGVMIDDLVTIGVDEPYRMFTSRAERRLLLRQDNAFFRLSHYAYQLGLINATLYETIKTEQQEINNVIDRLTKTNKSNEVLLLFNNDHVNYDLIRTISNTTLSDRALQSVHAELRYGPYLRREEKEAIQQLQYKKIVIPDQFSFDALPGLSKELQEKLKRYKPTTIAQAALIPGMTPAAITIMVLTLKKRPVDEKENNYLTC